MTDFSGKWISTFGPMELTQDGDRVRGVYVYNGVECTIDGTVADGRLTFTYQEPTLTGEGWFEARRNGHAFAGQWRPHGTVPWGDWGGERVGFDGVWSSDFGLMRLVCDGEQVQGFYEGAGGSSLEGVLKGGVLEFRYREPKAAGEGWF